jgi:hypothetical protein
MTVEVWFRTLSLVIAAALLGKAALALSMPGRFYAERQRQYASVSPPAKVLAPPVVIAGLALAAWYATIFHYQPWGWVVTASLTALACLSVHQLSECLACGLRVTGGGRVVCGVGLVRLLSHGGRPDREVLPRA